LLGGLGAGLALVMLLAVWKLSSGPISLAFLSPYVENTLGNFHKSFRIRLDDTILTWAGWERTLDIRVVNVRAVTPEGSLIASIPELSLSLSAKALLEGRLAPQSIEMFRPSLKLLRRGDGSFEIAFNTDEQTSESFFQRMFEELMARPDPLNSMSYLTLINIFDADLMVVDQALKTSWNAPSTQVQLRRDSTGIKGDVTFDVIVGGKVASFSVLGGYLAKERKLDIGIDFSELTPSSFSHLAPELASLASLDLPLQGTLMLTMRLDGAVESLGFDVTGGNGHIAIPVETAQKLGVLSAAQRIAVAGLELRGRLEGGRNKLEINNLSVSLGDNGEIYLPAPLDHKMPLRTLNARGRFFGDEQRLELDSVELDLQGPKAAVALNLLAGPEGASIGASGVVRGMTPELLPRYWPRNLGKDARTWIFTNISGGVVPEARVSVQLRSTEAGEFEVLSLKGDMDLKGMTVDYLAPMPKAVDTHATAHFTQEKFDIFITRSEAGGLRTSKGIVSLSGLNETDQFADIDLFIKGPVQNALLALESKPLEFSSALGFDPMQAGGMADAHLKLNFLMEHALTLDKVKVSATAGMNDVIIDNVVLGQGVSDGRLDLKVDKLGMDVTGDVKLGGIPANLSWRRNFAEEVPFQSRYDISSRIDNIRRLGDLGIDLAPLQGDFIKGGLGADIRLTLYDENKGKVQIKMDLADVALNVPAMGWEKDKGIPGTARAELDFEGELIVGIPSFSVSAGDFRVNGSAQYAETGTGLSRVNIDRLTYDRTDIAGVAIPGHDGGWTVSFHGASLDLEPVFDDLFSETDGEGEDIDLRLSMSAKIDKVWIGKDRFLKRVTGTFSHADERWRGIVVDGAVGQDKRFEIQLKPGGKGVRDLLIVADDAGEALKSLGLYENLIGGQLKFTGQFDDTDPDHPLEGTVHISDYRVVDAPALVQLVNILSLTGIVDALKGDGLAFSDFDVPFRLSKGVLEVMDAKATGISLGYTASGKIYTHADIVDLKGTMVPAYALNSALGNIPIIGTLLTGTEEGGGIFAASYSIKGPFEKPKVTVNPLTALAPGIFRNLFGLFGDAPATSEAPVEPDLKPVIKPRDDEMEIGKDKGL